MRERDKNYISINASVVCDLMLLASQVPKPESFFGLCRVSSSPSPALTLLRVPKSDSKGKKEEGSKVKKTFIRCFYALPYTRN